MTDHDLRASGTDARSVRRQAWATRIVFAANGGLFASWVSRIPAVRDHLDADERGLGFALLFTAVGSLIAMPLSGRLVAGSARAGSSRSASSLCALAYPALGLAPNLVVLGAVLLVVGAGVGVWDVAMNVSGHAVEEAAGRDLMPGFHAGWSIGTVARRGCRRAGRPRRPRPRACTSRWPAWCSPVAALLAVRQMPDGA